MLTAKQMKAVELLFKGDKKDYEIAAEVKISPQTFSKWKKKPEFVEALRTKSMDYAQVSMIPALIKSQFKLALTAKSEMVRFSATKDLLDRLNFVLDPEEKEVGRNIVIIDKWSEDRHTEKC